MFAIPPAVEVTWQETMARRQLTAAHDVSSATAGVRAFVEGLERDTKQFLFVAEFTRRELGKLDEADHFLDDETIAALARVEDTLRTWEVRYRGLLLTASDELSAPWRPWIDAYNDAVTAACRAMRDGATKIATRVAEEAAEAVEANAWLERHRAKVSDEDDEVVSLDSVRHRLG